MTRDRAERVGWIAGGVGLAGAALGWILTPQVFPHAWLAALSAWLGWPLGCMGLLLIHALTGGRWGDAIRGRWLPAWRRCRFCCQRWSRSPSCCPRSILGRAAASPKTCTTGSI